MEKNLFLYSIFSSLYTVGCEDMEWIYSKISEDKLMFYHCAQFKADGPCAAKIIRGLSTHKNLTLADKQAFRDAFARFGEPLPVMVDPLNNGKWFFVHRSFSSKSSFYKRFFICGFVPLH